MNDTSAIVVTYNNAATLAACLESLIKHDMKVIVVVDNASTDNTVHIAHAYQAQVIQQSKNVGFATAANIGASAISTPYMLFLNPDASLQTSIQRAIKHLRSTSKIGIIGLGLYDKDGMPERDSFGQEPSLPTIFMRQIHRPGPRVMENGWVSGGALLMRTETFRTLGGFDEKFFLYWEDVDICRRAREAGCSVMHMPAIRVQHVRGASLANRKHKAQLYDKSADRYFQKHYAAPIWLLQRFLRRLYRLLQPLAR